MRKQHLLALLTYSRCVRPEKAPAGWHRHAGPVAIFTADQCDMKDSQQARCSCYLLKEEARLSQQGKQLIVSVPVITLEFSSKIKILKKLNPSL